CGSGRAEGSPALAHRDGVAGCLRSRLGLGGAAAGTLGGDLLGQGGGSGESEVGLERREEFLADALDLHEVLDAGEGSMLLAVFDDALGLLGADPGKVRELLGRRLVDVDLLGGGSVGRGGVRRRESRDTEDRRENQGSPGSDSIHRELLLKTCCSDSWLWEKSGFAPLAFCPHRVPAIRRSPSAPPFVTGA